MRASDGSAGPDGYIPTVSAEHAERIRRWHENAYAAAKAEATSTQTFTYLGRTLVVPPEVQPITGMSHLLGEAVLADVRGTDRVLDMGTGSGVNAILAASIAEDVTAVDVNPVALDAARQNAQRNGVAERIDVRHSDVFGDVDGAFDLVVIDPPFRWFAPRDLLESAMTDENYRMLTTFFRDVRRHLTLDGRILLSFGTSGDLGFMQQLADDEGFVTKAVARESLVKDGWQVGYFVFRLTAQ